jgi:hypothetical protein
MNVILSQHYGDLLGLMVEFGSNRVARQLLVHPRTLAIYHILLNLECTERSTISNDDLLSNTSPDVLVETDCAQGVERDFLVKTDVLAEVDFVVETSISETEDNISETEDNISETEDNIFETGENETEVLLQSLEGNYTYNISETKAVDTEVLLEYLEDWHSSLTRSASPSLSRWEPKSPPPSPRSESPEQLFLDKSSPMLHNQCVIS